MIVRTPLGELIIDGESGETTTDVDALVAVAGGASAAVLGGYIEPWRPPLQFVLNWAEAANVAVVVIGQPQTWPPAPPGAVA